MLRNSYGLKFMDPGKISLRMKSQSGGLGEGGLQVESSSSWGGLNISGEAFCRCRSILHLFPIWEEEVPFICESAKICSTYLVFELGVECVKHQAQKLIRHCIANT